MSYTTVENFKNQNVSISTPESGQATDDKGQSITYYKSKYYYDYGGDYVLDNSGKYIKDAEGHYYPIVVVNGVEKIKLPDESHMDVPAGTTERWHKQPSSLKDLCVEFPTLTSSVRGFSENVKSYKDKKTGATNTYKEYTVNLIFDPSNPEHDKIIKFYNELHPILGNLISGHKSDMRKPQYDPKNPDHNSKLYREPTDPNTGMPVVGRPKNQYYKITSSTRIKYLEFQKDSDGNIVLDNSGKPKYVQKVVKYNDFNMFVAKKLTIIPIVKIAGTYCNSAKPSVANQQYLTSAVVIKIEEGSAVDQNITTEVLSKYSNEMESLADTIKQLQLEIESMTKETPIEQNNFVPPTQMNYNMPQMNNMMPQMNMNNMPSIPNNYIPPNMNSNMQQSTTFTPPVMNSNAVQMPNMSSNRMPNL